MNLYQVLTRPAPNRPFLVTNQRTWSYGEIYQTAGELGAVLEALDVQPGDRVAVVVDKSAHAVSLYLACLRVGAVFLPLNPSYTDAEIEWFVSDAGANVLICSPDREQALGEVVSTLLTLSTDGQGSLVDRCAGAVAPIASRTESDLAAMLYTSGTTGRSKGAMLSHGALIDNAQALYETWQWQSDDILLHVLPIFHVHGLFVALHCAMLGGSSVLFRDTFDPEDVLGLLPQTTVLMGVPTVYTRLTASGRLSVELMRQMRLVVSGSAPLPEQTLKAFYDQTGYTILERYGMTEAGMICSNPYDGDRVAGTVGFPIGAYRARVAGIDDEEVERGEVGILQIKGPSLFSGYWKLPDKTNEEFTTDGYFRTGDLASMDDSGRVRLMGRSHDLIITGGYNVYPREVERCLVDVPGVLEAAVIGIPDDDLGEMVAAVLVGEADEEAVRASLESVIARYKQPRRYRIVTELPRNAMGKVQKNQLRADWNT